MSESRLIKDLFDGTDREIDVALEIPSGPRRMLIGIECRDHSRPADVSWIDELAGKYIHLPVDRVVAVSRSGFTKAARTKASGAKIELLTLDEAIASDWGASIIANPFLCLASTRYKWNLITLIRDSGPDDPNAIVAEQGSLKVYRDGGPEIQLATILHDKIAHEPFKSMMTNVWQAAPEQLINLTVLTPGWLYRGPQSERNELHSAHLYLFGGIDYIELRLHPLRYAGITVAHGEATIDDTPVAVVFVQRDGEAPRVMWYLNDSAEFPWRGLDAAPFVAVGEPGGPSSPFPSIKTNGSE